MGYIEKDLVPGETVPYKTRLHWIVLKSRAGRLTGKHGDEEGPVSCELG